MGFDSIPLFAGLTLTGLTASRLIWTDSKKLLASKDLIGLVAGTANRVTISDDSSGGITLSIPQDYHTGASPTLAGLTLTNAAVIGSNSVVFQPNANSTTFFQVLDAAGSTPVLNIDTTNNFVGVGGNPGRLLSVIAGAETAYFQITNSTVGVGWGRGLEIYSTTGGDGGIKNRESGTTIIGGEGSVVLQSTGSNVYMAASTGIIAFQEGTTTTCFYRSAIAYTQMLLAIRDNVGNQFILTNYDNSSHNHDHAVQTNPTFYIHSDYSAEKSNNQWGSFAHDQTNFVITTGVNEGVGYIPTTIENAIVFAPRGTERMRIQGAGDVGINETNPETLLELTHTQPTITGHVSTHSNNADSGAWILRGKREDGDGTETESGQITMAHDGAGVNDQLAYMKFGVNTGSGVVDVVKIDSNRNTYIGDGGVTNYAQFETDGTLVFKGAATTFNDIVISLSSARVPAANAPSWDSFIGNLNAYTYGLNDFQEFSTELSHSYKNGATIEFHIHGAVNGVDGDDRTIKFEIEYTIADVQPESGLGDVYSATTTINAELTIPAATTDLTAFTIDIGDDTTGNFVQGAIVKGRVRRITSSGSEPSADPFLTEVGIHIESDTIGTRTATSK